MNLFPHQKRLLSIPWEPDEAEHMLRCFTKDINEYRFSDNLVNPESLYKFNGWVHDLKFKISKTVNYPQNYLPIAKGEIEKVKSGSVVIISYDLFPATKSMIIFSLILTFFIVIIFGLIRQNIWIALFSILVFLVHYFVALGNFNMHVKDCHRILYDIWE